MGGGKHPITGGIQEDADTLLARDIGRELHIRKDLKWVVGLRNSFPPKFVIPPAFALSVPLTRPSVLPMTEIGFLFLHQVYLMMKLALSASSPHLLITYHLLLVLKCPHLMSSFRAGALCYRITTY